MKKLSAILILILCIVGAVYAQHEPNLPAGSKVYIEPMNGGSLGMTMLSAQGFRVTHT